MEAVSATPAARARKYLQLTLQRLAGKQEAVALALGVAESTVSRMKGDQLEHCLQMLAVLGLKVVPQEMKCYRPKDIDPYIQIAKQHMAMVESIEQLSIEDQE